MQRLRRILHLTVVFSMLMTLVAVAFPAGVGAANLDITPQSVNFPNQEVGTQSAPVQVTVTNIGNGPVNINSVTGGSPNFEVTGNGCLIADLQIGQSCSFGVVFRPQGPGALAATITISSTIGGNSFVQVGGTGVAPVLSYSPAGGMNFGNIQIGQTSPQQVLTITNTGNSAVLFPGPIFSVPSPEFTVEGLSPFTCQANVPLAPGNSCQARITFNPLGPVGPRNGGIGIVYQYDSSTAASSYPVRGNAVQAQVSATPNPLNFADQLINSPSAPQKITFNNTGVGPVTLLNVQITGTDPAAFQLLNLGANNCFSGFANTLQVGGSCDVYVRFLPTTAGPKTAQVQFTIADAPAGVYPAVNYYVALNGTGTTPTGTVSPQAINFGTQRVGTVSGPVVVTVTNTSNGGYTVPVLTPSVADFQIQADTCSNTFLQANQSCTFSVVFAPGTTGIINGTINVPGPNPVAVQLTGIGVIGNISATPNPVNFGDQTVGAESAPVAITVTNNGPGPATISSLSTALADFIIKTDNCTGQVLASVGATCTVTVAFKPGSTGTKNDLLTIVYNAGTPAQNYQVALVGRGINNQLSISPNGTYNFGNVVVGQKAYAAFTVTNNGPNDYTITTVTAAPTPPFSVFFQNCLGVLAPTQSCTIIVEFAPTVPGPVTGSLSVNPVVILVGNGVSANGALLADKPQLTFGPQQVGSQSQTQAVIISNNGNEPVRINTITAAPNDYIPTAGAGTNCQPNLVLDPGQSCIIWLAFQPDGTPLGDVNGSLTINYTSNAVGIGGGNLIILLRGTATTPNGTVSPLQLDFGVQEINTTSGPQTVTFTNTGGSSIVLPVVTIGGADASQYLIQTDSCSNAVVIAGGTCQISVVFKPTSAGAKNADLRVGPLSNPVVVTLKGIGFDPQLVVAPAGPVDFGAVIVGSGQSSLRAFTVTNTSSNPKFVPAPTFTGDFALEAEDCTVAALGPGQSCTIVVRFVPSAIGPRNGTMTVNPVIILVGVGVAPNGALSASPVQLTFGPQPVGTQSGAQQIIVSNNGNIPVTLANPAVTVSPNWIVTGGAGNTCQNGAILGPGQSCSFWVAFLPTATGNLNGVAVVNYTSAGVVGTANLIVLLRGQAVTPTLTLSPTQLVFGPQALFTASAQQTVTVTNTSGNALTLGALGLGGTNPTDFQLIGDLCSNATLGAGASCTFSVIFLPISSTGAKTATVIIPISGLGNVTVALSGQALAAQQGSVGFSPAYVNFGYQQVLMTTAPQQVVLTNTGTTPITVNSVAVSGANAADFQPIFNDGCSTAVLNPGQSCSVLVRFKPGGQGLREAQLDFTTTAPGSPHSVYLYGVGITPVLAISPSQLNFGNLQVGSTSGTQTVTVINNSNGPLTISSVVLAGADFSKLNDSCENSTRVPGDSCKFDVVFQPTATGPRNGTATINISGGNGPFVINLIGVGLTPSGMLSPLQLNFGDVAVGTTSTVQTVTLTNTGSGSIAVPNIFLAGPNIADFLIQTDGCSGQTIPSGGTCTISVVARPQQQGPRNAQLAISPLFNDNIVTLKVNGTLPSPSFQAAALDFGKVVINTTSAKKQLTVTNTGPADLIIFGSPTIGGANAADFTIVTDQCNNKTLKTGESCFLEITFKPSALGIRNAYVDFTTNLPTASQKVSLTGEGIPPAQYTVALTVANGVGANCTATGPAGPFQANDMPAFTFTAAAGTTVIGWELDGYYVGFASPLDFKINAKNHTLNLICVATPTFNDIAGSPYKADIEKSAAFGFIKGYQGLSGPYGPNDNFLRSQAAVVMVRVANRTNAWSSEVHPNTFSDLAGVDPESANAIATGYEKNVIRGLGFGVFAPFANVTEMETVAFIARTMAALTLELEQYGRLPSCPVPQQGTPAVAPLGPKAGCPVPPQYLTGQPANKATKWESQPNDGTIYGSVPDGSGFRKDISTYVYYAGFVPGTGNQFNPWPTWASPAKRQQIAAIVWKAYASYWGVDRVDQFP